jgi:hypothetical protein
MQTVEEGYQDVEQHSYHQKTWKREVDFINPPIEVNIVEFIFNISTYFLWC